MPELLVEFEVFCSCGEGLCQQSIGKNTKRGLIVTVEPCTKCLQKEEERGYEKGYQKGYDEGCDDGTKDGLEH